MTAFSYSDDATTVKTGPVVTCCVAVQGRRYRLRGSYAAVMSWLRQNIFNAGRGRA